MTIDSVLTEARESRDQAADDGLKALRLAGALADFTDRARANVDATEREWRLFRACRRGL